MNKWTLFHRIILLLLICLSVSGCGIMGGAFSFLKGMGGSSKSGGTDVTASANFGGDHQQKYKVGGEELNVESNEGVVAKELTIAEGEFVQQSEDKIFSSNIKGDAGDITTTSTDAPPWHVQFQNSITIISLVVIFLLFILIFVAKMMPSGKQNNVINNLRKDVDDNKRKHRSSDSIANEVVSAIVAAHLKKINKD